MAIEGKFVGVKEAAEILGCTDSNVRKLIASGMLEAKVLSERVKVIPRKSLDRYAAKEIRVGRRRKNSERICP